MILKKVKYKECREIWKNITEENYLISPYMNVDFIDYYLKYFKTGKQRWNKKIAIYKGMTSKGKNIIIPLLLSLEGKDAYICGDLCASGYLDFIYPKDTSDEEFDEMFEALHNSLKGVNLHLNKINQSSALYKYLDYRYKRTSENECVFIPIPISIDDYYNSLSKSVRQNYRTAKNRISRENKEFTLDFYNNKDISKSIKKEIMDIYDKREAERNGTHKNKMKSIIRNMMNPISNITFKSNRNFVSVLRIDGKASAFLAGIVTGDGKTLVLPRLSINTEYGVYCPGNLLIFETIRYLIECTEVLYFDLSRGNEKYKFAMGGKFIKIMLTTSHYRERLL